MSKKVFFLFLLRVEPCFLSGGPTLGRGICIQKLAALILAVEPPLKSGPELMLLAVGRVSYCNINTVFCVCLKSRKPDCFSTF